MQLTFDIPDKDLAELGKETIQQEINKMLKWLKVKQSFNKISVELQKVDGESYHRELQVIREKAGRSISLGFDFLWNG